MHWPLGRLPHLFGLTQAIGQWCGYCSFVRTCSGLSLCADFCYFLHCLRQMRLELRICIHPGPRRYFIWCLCVRRGAGVPVPPRPVARFLVERRTVTGSGNIVLMRCMHPQPELPVIYYNAIGLDLNDC